jgi:DNA-binding transcriptional MocR family regulator
MSDATRRGVVAVAERFGTTIVEDRTLAHLRFHGGPAEPIAAALPERQAIVVESISKLFWGGLRVGWIRAAQSTIATLARRKSLVDLATPLLSQLVAARLVPTIAETQPLVRARIAERYEHLTQLMREQLPEWSWTAPAGGLSLWTQLPFGDAADLVRIGARHGVELVPGNAMSSSGNLAGNLRIPYVLGSAQMADGIGRLASAWHEYEAIAHRRSTHSLVV